MKPFINPVSLNEKSERITMLHNALKTLGFSVSAAEEKSKTAGKSTLKQMRALQKKYNIKCDDKYVVDQTTYEALQKLIEEMNKTDQADTSNSFVESGKVINSK